MVKLPEEYRWSSHKRYLQPLKVPSWLKVEEVLEQLGGSRGFHVSWISDTWVDLYKSLPSFSVKTQLSSVSFNF